MALVGWAEAERGAKLGRSRVKLAVRRGSVRQLWEQLFRRMADRHRIVWVGTEVGTESTADVPSCPLAAFVKMPALQESQLPSHLQRGLNSL